MSTYRFAPDQDRLLPLDGIRGYAVFVVFLVHFTQNLAGYVGKNLSGPIAASDFSKMFLVWLVNSNYGVYLFFILSGFLIGRMFVTSSISYPTFIARRFTRIYPAFLLSILISGGIEIFVTGYMKFSWTVLVQNLLFLNGWAAIGEIASYNFVTWSLFFEFVFYLTVPLALLPFRGVTGLDGERLFTAFCVVAITALVMRLGTQYLYFLGGLVLANTSDEKLKAVAAQIPEALLIPIYLMITGAYAFGIAQDLFPPLYLLAGSALILKAAYGDGILQRIFTYRWLRALGTISYSFYLLHATVCILYFYLAQKYLPGGPKLLIAAASIPLVFAITWIASAAMYKVAEEPYFRKRRRSRSVESREAIAAHPSPAGSQTVP